ncbi:NAD(P)-binding protein [Thozetella sp. PMI_491]|nr:NAD(P)-binding protein [Thozetella sp. PMI_491]
MAIPPTLQTGAWIDEPGSVQAVRIRQDIPIPAPSAGEVLVKLECTGVCHSDVYGLNGHTPMTANIAGHEGVGRICGVGADVSPQLLNRRVGIKWLYSYCNNCEICAEDATCCPNQHNSGRDVPGTFQQYCVSPADFLTFIPDALDSIAAAPLLCAGITIYSAITKLKLKPGQWLVLPGAGGGLGHLGVQIAASKGIKVIAIDTGEEKRALCMSLGATCFLDFLVDDIPTAVKTLTDGYGVHGSVCLSNSRSSYEQSLSVLRNGGTLVCVGLAKDELPISPFMMIVKGIRIIGSSVGSEEEMTELLEMASRGEVKSMVKVFEFERIRDVLEMIEQNKVAGRIVVNIPE